MTFAVLIAAVTIEGGWWTVPVLAAVWVMLMRFDHRPVHTTVLGAVLGWALLLAIDGYYGPVAAVGSTLAAALGMPAWGFVTATLLFPALLAGAAALLVKPGPSG